MIKIKRASIDDISQLSEAFDQYRIWYRMESDIEKAKKFLSERMQSNESIIFLAEEDGKTLGFTQLYPLFSSTRMQRLWLLNDLFVYSDHRGKGISKLLIEAAKKHCLETGGCAVSLETEKNNTIGNILYPKTDFVLNKSHNFYEWSAK